MKWAAGIIFVLSLGLIVLLSVVAGVQPLLGLFGGVAVLAAVVTFRWPALGLVASLLTLIIGQTLRIPIGAGEGTILPNDFIIPFVLATWALRSLIDRKPLLSVKPFSKLVGLFSGVMVLSLLFAVTREEFTKNELIVSALYIVRWFEYFALFFMARSVIRREHLTRWITFLIGITLALAFLGFLQLYLVPDFSRFVPLGWDPHVGRLLSTWYDPNFLGGFFAAMLMILIALIHEPGITKRKWIIGSGIIILVALVLTFSRSGYAGFVVGFGVLSLLRTRHFLALGVLAALAVFLFVPRVQERVIGIRSVDETAQLRVTSWQNAVTVLQDYPWLGVGYNTYRFVQVRYGFQEDTAEHSAGGSDSSFLTVAVTTGVLGLILYLMMYTKFFGSLFRAARAAAGPPERALAYGTIGALVTLIIHGQFVNGLLYPHLLELQWVLLGFVTGVSTDKELI